MQKVQNAWKKLSLEEIYIERSPLQKRSLFIRGKIIKTIMYT